MYLLHTTCSYSCDLSPSSYIINRSQVPSPSLLRPAFSARVFANLPTCIRLFGALIFPSYVPSIDNHNHISDPDVAWPKATIPLPSIANSFVIPTRTKLPSSLPSPEFKINRHLCIQFFASVIVGQYFRTLPFTCR